MARPKIARKSTTVDMTAMCDVAFLLLAFFILTTKPKPSEAVTVDTPSSVAAKVAPQKDVVMVWLTSDGKVFLSFGDDQEDKDRKAAVLDDINSSKTLGLTPAEIKALTAQPFIGVPIANLKQQASLPDQQITGVALPGIPCQDTTNNQMTDWVRSIVSAYEGGTLNLLLKGDNLAKYPSFKNILTAFKKNDQFHFQLVTNPQSIPSGTELYVENMKGIKQQDE